MRDDLAVQKIENILSKYFDEEYINDENYVNSTKIKNAIIELTEGKNDWKDREIFNRLRIAHHDFSFDNQTHFYHNDRCLRIEATKKSKANLTLYYCICLSILGFFSIYQKKFTLTSTKKYLYEPLQFLEENTDNFCDSVFQTVRIYYPEALWLSNKILLTPIYQLNIFSDLIKKDILIFDFLFTQHH